MKSYLAYIRVSTVRQGERGSSLHEQRDAIENYARRNGLAISGWVEEMETAAKQGRRAFNRMLAELGRNRIAGVIIHKIDRSSRNLRDWARLGELMDRGVEVHFVQDNIDLTTRGGRLSADIQAVVAADYSRNLRDEVRKGVLGRLKQGFYPFHAPLGYLDCGTARTKAIDPQRGSLIRHAFELYATGNFSIELLAVEMAALGLRTASGRPLPKSHVASILHNPFYMGLMRYPSTGQVFEGKHEPLIPAALFNRIQRILEGRLYPRTQIHRFLFRRLIRCASCGRSLTGERQKGNVYYRCHSYACRGVSLAEREVTNVVIRELGFLRLDEQDIGDFRDVLHEELQESEACSAAKAAQLERELSLVKQRLERLTDALLDDTIDKAAHDARRESLLRQKRELEDRLQHDTSTTAGDVVNRFEQAFAAQQTYLGGTEDEKRNLVGVLGSNLVAHGKNVEFPMHSPFRELREWRRTDGSWPRRSAVRTKGPELARRRRTRAKAFVKRLALRMAEGV